MSEINSFSDYTNKYNSNVDYSALFGGTSNSSSLGGTNILSDYASIKNGSYGKLLKAYYAKQDAEKTAGTGDTSQKLTLMKTSADSLKKSADALNASSLWEKKKIKKTEICFYGLQFLCKQNIAESNKYRKYCEQGNCNLYK